MEYDPRQRRHLLHTHRPPATNPGLTRFRSAPSSFFATLLESCEEFLNRPSSPETERMMTRLISDDDDIAGEFPAPNGVNSNQLSQFTKTIKSETEAFQTRGGNNNIYGGGEGGGGGGSASSRNYYQISSQPPPLPNRDGGSNLIRQSSTPAGFFSDISIDNGSYGAGMGGSNGGEMAAAFRPPTNRFGTPMNFSSASSGMASSMVQMMNPIAETGHRRIISSELLIVHDNNSTTTITTESSFSQGQPEDHEFAADFSWDIDAEKYSPTLKRARNRDDHEDQSTNFSRSNSSELQNDEEFARPASMLAHQLSLPNTSAEMSAVNKFLQFQDSVPWRTRAKRGCATHPRSIAERVRRTRISERMRKLQDLVPNMDKQTNTSEMLDFAVEHIKDLQKQLKMLSASRASCRCQK